MDERIRHLLRIYTEEPTDDLAHQIIREFQRSEAVRPTQWLTIPSEWSDESPRRVRKTIRCPGCQHDAYLVPASQYSDSDESFLANIETINDEVGLYQAHYECFCATGGSEGCSCKAPRTDVTWGTQICAWCEKSVAVRISGFGYALGPGAYLCSICDPG